MISIFEKTLNRLVLGTLVVTLLPVALTAAPPTAPEGWKWVIVDELTDEFNDTEVDAKKWNKFNPSWVGRDPGRFIEAQATEKDGYLMLKNKQVADPSEQVWVHTGFVSSKQKLFTAGYYSECSLKAAKDGTVTGFWMSRPGETEIDVQEAVGYPANGNHALTTMMRTNTHYHPDGWDKDKKTPEDFHLEQGVGDVFHTYGVWWKDTRNISFYYNGAFTHTVETGGEFDRPMQVNLNTETQKWIGNPFPEKLNDDILNTTYIDFIRTWKLVQE